MSEYFEDEEKKVKVPQLTHEEHEELMDMFNKLVAQNKRQSLEIKELKKEKELLSENTYKVNMEEARKKFLEVSEL